MMTIREIGLKYLGNNVLVRKWLYFLRGNIDKVYQTCMKTDAPAPAHIKKDMIYAHFRYGVGYDEYFFFDFLNNHNDKYRKSFITDSSRFKYFAKLNKYENLEIFNDKWKSYCLFGKFYNRDMIELKENDDAFREFVKKHPVFIAKINNSSCGNGIEKIDIRNYESLDELYTYLINSKHFLLEEIIAQSEKLSKLHPTSVNTIRVATILLGKNTDTYKVEIFHPFLKIGQGGSLVDNGGAGGIIVKIDPNSGELITNGVDEANNRYDVHPDTKVNIKGYQLPDWQQMINLVTECAKVLPSNRYTGWDLAHTEQGWIVVEANARGQFIGQQMTDLVGKQEEMDMLLNML